MTSRVPRKEAPGATPHPNCVHNVSQRVTVCCMGQIRQVGVRELRQNTSPLLRDVAEGQTLEITHHGHPIARLIPVAANLWSALIACNEVIPARIAAADIFDRPARDYPDPVGGRP